MNAQTAAAPHTDSPASARLARIEQCLREALQPTELQVQDHSAAHAGHAGAVGGKGHFSVRIVSERFAGLSVLQRHRLVNQALEPLWDRDLHAMSINALTSDDLPR